MKTSIVFILIFVCQLNVLADKPYDSEKESYNKYRRLINNNENNRGISNYNEYLKIEEEINESGKSFIDKKQDDNDDDDDPGNPDARAIIVRPCPFFDRFCIRKFFAEHSNCKIVPGPVIEPFFSAENQLYLVNNNITVTIADNLVTGLNGRIDEFYVNKVTENLVLSVFFEDVQVVSLATFFRFNRNGQEPVETMADTAIDYLKLTVTIVIPNVNRLRLEDAEINGYLGVAVIPFFIGPRALESTDPIVLEEVASLLADIPTAAIENLPTVAPLVAKIFIQKNICDFGVPINRI